MDAAQFADYTNALAGELGHPIDPTSGVVKFDVDGVEIVLTHGEMWGDGCITLVCDVCEIGTRHRTAILEEALEANIAFHGLWSPMFGIDGGKGRLVLMMTLPAELMPVTQMQEVLARIVLLAKGWRTNHELRVAPEAVPS